MLSQYDVVIIGGGICGCSLLYQLARYEVRAVLIEKENDVSVGTTKANSGIIHAGYDPAPGTLMACYNVAGNRMVAEICKELDVPYRKTGSLVLAFTEEDRGKLEILQARGRENGVEGELRLLEKAELLEAEPNINPAVNSALYASSAGIVSPWELASAQAELAIVNGLEVKLNCEALGICRQGGTFKIDTNAGPITTRFIVNAAGISADLVSGMVEKPDFAIYPSRGEYFLLDTSQGNVVKHIIFQVPGKDGKGVLVAPTVHGNLIVGPSSAPAERDDLSTSAEGLAQVKELARHSVYGIDFTENIRNFAGLRAVSNRQDFIVGESPACPGFFYMAGIKSPGLTAAPAIAKEIVQDLKKAGLQLENKPNYQAKRQVNRFGSMTDTQRAATVKGNSLYGKVVCRCRGITEGEIVDALNGPIPVQSLDAVKRRCNTGMGRCQGGFCGPRVQAIIARETGNNMKNISQDRKGMEIVTKQTKII